MSVSSGSSEQGSSTVEQEDVVDDEVVQTMMQIMQEEMRPRLHGVTMVELERACERRDLPFIGDMSLGTPQLDELNICVWAGVNANFASALSLLIAQRIVEINPTQALVYLLDGGILELPLAQQKRKYAELHWLPVIVDKGPAWGD